MSVYSSTDRFRIEGLDGLDRRELTKSVPVAVEVDHPAGPSASDEYGMDPGSIALVLEGTANASMLIAIWLLRRVKKTHARYSFERISPDGTVNRLTVERDDASASPPSTELVGKVAEFFHINDLGELIHSLTEG